MNRGVSFGALVATGVALASTLAPVERGAAAGAAGLGVALALGSARAWGAVPVGLGLWRMASARTSFDARRVRGPALVDGRLEVIERRGRGLVVEAGERRLLLSAEDSERVPAPGHELRTLLRADPIRSRADPAAFRAERWAELHALHGRGRLLGDISGISEAPGAAARLRRLASRVRARARERLGQGPEGSLLVALVLGDRRGLSTTDRDAFRVAGLAHVLALSGMHVGVLALGAASLLRSVGVRGSRVVPPTLAFLASFAFLTGANPPILRACLASSVALLGFAGGRRHDPVHALGLVFGVMLLANPFALADVGFRLSFTATVLLALRATRDPPGARVRSRGLPGRLRPFAEAIGVSAVVTLGTLPEIGNAFGSVSLLSPITNLVAAPFASAALGWGALAAFLPGPEWIGQGLARAARLSARALLACARLARPLPGGNVILPACSLPAQAGVLLVAVRWARGTVPSRREAGAGLVLVLAAVRLGLPADRLTVLDVGQGDAVLLETRGGSALVDGGPAGRPGDAPFLARALAHRGRRRPDAIVATHGHADHVGGLETLPEGAFVVSPPREGKAPPRLAKLERSAIGAGSVRAREPVDLPGTGAMVFSPWALAGAPPGAGENDLSLGTRFTVRGVRALLLGDLPAEGERELLSVTEPGALRAAILLAPHHGSRDSGSAELLDRVGASLVLVSCGAGNPHGHPHEELLARVRARGSALGRTDRDGTVAITFTPRGFRVRWQRGYPGSSRPSRCAARREPEMTAGTFP